MATATPQPTIPTTFQATVDLRERLEKERERRGLRTMADVIRALLEEGLK